MFGSVINGRDIFGMLWETRSCNILVSGNVLFGEWELWPFLKGLLPASAPLCQVWNSGLLRGTQPVSVDTSRTTWPPEHGTKPTTCHNQTSPDILISRVPWPFCLPGVSCKQAELNVCTHVPISCDLISVLHSRKLSCMYSSSVPLWFRRPFIRS